MADPPQDAPMFTAEEYQEYQRLKQQQTQPPPVPTIQELMEQIIVVQEKTAAKESGPRIKITEPGEFNGDPEHLRKFLNECEAYFESVPKATESQKSTVHSLTCEQEMHGCSQRPFVKHEKHSTKRPNSLHQNNGKHTSRPITRHGRLLSKRSKAPSMNET